MAGDLPLASFAVAGSQVAFGDEQLFLEPQEATTPVRILLRRRAGQPSLPYRLAIFNPGSAPEHVPALLAYGDTTSGEWLDSAGESDRFQFAGTEGDEVIVFLRTDTDRPGESAQIEIRSVNDTVLNRTGFNASTRSFEEKSATVRLSQTGMQSVTVSRAVGGAPGALPGYRGPYSLWVHRIERAPETAPVALAPGDTVTESLDVVGDIDEFALTVEAGQELHINVAIGTAMASGLEVRLDGQSIIPTHLTDRVVSTLDSVGTALWRVTAPGVHQIRVYGPTRVPPSLGTTEYRLEVYQVAAAPEVAAAAIALDVPVLAERIDRPGDLDVYSLSLSAGDVFNYFLAAPTLAAEQEIHASVITPEGDTLGGLGVSGDGGLSTFYGALTATTTGSYELHVRGLRAFDTPYELRVLGLDPAPESVPAAVPLNVWITTESLDEAGDLDRFNFTADPFSVYDLQIRATELRQPLFSLYSSVPGVGTNSEGGWARFATSDRYGFAYTVAEPGLIDLLVQAFPNSVDIPEPARYEMLISAWSFWPETADTSLVLGVPTSESLDAPVDSDEFSVAAVPDASYEFTLTVPAGASATHGLRMQVRREGETFTWETVDVVGEGVASAIVPSPPAGGRLYARVFSTSVGIPPTPYQIEVIVVP
ncbi:MAG: hypothetical protein KF709_02090 [Gemmatimonadaceae bacterium]|nr:hypothetical protein [Gemmatimonadaceae bacterium]